MLCFNSRSREGSDSQVRCCVLLRSSFNSRSREGSDFSFFFRAESSLRFQFTLPRGERRLASAADRLDGLFQFTLPRGERLRVDRLLHLQRKVSIHAPARGAT